MQYWSRCCVPVTQVESSQVWSWFCWFVGMDSLFRTSHLAPTEHSSRHAKTPAIGGSKICLFVDTPWRNSTQRVSHRGIKDFCFVGSLSGGMGQGAHFCCRPFETPLWFRLCWSWGEGVPVFPCFSLFLPVSPQGVPVFPCFSPGQSLFFPVSPCFSP